MEIEVGQTRRSFPLRADVFDVARAKALEICAGDRLLVKTNYRRESLLNGDITVRTIRVGIITACDGRVIDTARVRHLSHGYVVTSHKSQSKTADHVIVVAERLDPKSADAACSRGRFSCSVHVPDKANLFARLADGERPAAIEVLAQDVRSKEVLPRNRAWAALNRARASMLTNMQRAMKFEWWRETLREHCKLLSGHSTSHTDHPGLSRCIPRLNSFTNSTRMAAAHSSSSTSSFKSRFL